MTSVKDSKWDRGQSSRRPPISEQDKKFMADYLQVNLKMGRPRDELLEELAKKYQRSRRQIERHIARFLPRKQVSQEPHADERWKIVALVQKWREEVAGYSVGNLLQWWLDRTDAGASIRYYTDEDIQKLSLESGDQNAELPRATPLSLQVEKDPGFVFLRQKSPASDIWTLFDSWHKQTIPYTTALFSVLERVRRLLVRETGMPYSELREKGLAQVIFFASSQAMTSEMSSEKMSQIERRAMVLLACDLLVSGIAELPSNSCCAHLLNELRELQLIMNLEMSAATDMLGEGSWPSRIREIRPSLAVHPHELTQDFLDKSIEWQSTQDSLLEVLERFENE